MSKKPPKHSESKKRKESSATRLKNSWPSSRDAARRVSLRPERHLIVTEGTKTEPLYFGGLCKRINSSYRGDLVTVDVKGAGENTISLFEYAKSLACSNVRGYSHVWVVYDKDSFPSVDFNAVADKCEVENSGGACFHAIWSNECFELWYLLHFEYLQADLDRGMYIPRLDAYLKDLGMGPYCKNRSDMFEVLEGRLDCAIKNAYRLEERNAGRTPEASRPGTMVHKLVGYLRPFMRKGAQG